ncbi:MAG: ATP-binding protein [Candidatus Nanohaloarchaea archaeon]|nr:ATP-binding protein [Candidatus Nanohaloarchaea archaeon]
MESLIRLAKRAGMDDQPDVQRLLRAAAASNNAVVRRRVKRVLEVRAAQHQEYPFTPNARTPSPSDDTQVRLGSTHDGSPVTVTATDLSKHVLVAGQSGAGKTTLFYNLMDQLDVPFWTFDLKQDYRHLARSHDILVLPWRQFRINPLQPPPGVTPRRWAQVVVEILGHSTALLSGSKNYVLKHIFELYRSRLNTKVDEPVGDGGGTVAWPTVADLQSSIEEDSMNYARKSANYRDTVLNRLEAMTMAAGQLFDAEQGHVQPGLIDRDVVFEFDGLGNDVQDFLMELLFAYVYEYRLAQAHRGNQLRHVFFLDEGKRVFSVYKERQDAAGLPTIDELTAKMREFGEGLVVADQEPSKLTDSIKANTHVKILLAMGDRKQFHEMADSMHLASRQQDFAGRLDVGEAVVQVGNTPPFPVDLPRYSVEKDVADAELQRMQAEQWQQLHTDIVTDSGYNREGEIGERQENRDDGDGDAGENGEDPVDLSEEAVTLLRDVVDRPFVKLSDRYEKVSSANKGNQAKNELVEGGFVEERQVTAVRGRMKLLELTDKGRGVLEEEGADVSGAGRGGIVHRYWQHRIQEALETWGWAVELEVADADLGAERDGASVAVEVSMENVEREVDHAKQRLRDGFDGVVVVGRNESVRDGLMQRVEEESVDSESVGFLRFQDFVGDSPAAQDVFEEFRDTE